MRAALDFALWLGVQMPLAGLSWLFGQLYGWSSRAYWALSITRRRLMGRPLVAPHDALLGHDVPDMAAANVPDAPPGGQADSGAPRQADAPPAARLPDGSR